MKGRMPLFFLRKKDPKCKNQRTWNGALVVRLIG